MTSLPPRLSMTPQQLLSWDPTHRVLVLGSGFEREDSINNASRGTREASGARSGAQWREKGILRFQEGA
jgi:hypothetical protein